jgi:hypothetical protein
MRKQLLHRLFLVVLSFVIALFSATHFEAAASAQAVPFYWDSIDANIQVQENGDMLVTETQTYVFEKAHTNQRYRYLPLDKVDQITDVSVQENNQVIPSQVGRDKNQLWIRWEHPLNPPEKHGFVLKYRVLGGLQVEGANTLVFWKAIFADRTAVIKAAKVRVELPEALSGKVLSFQSFGAPATAKQLNAKTFEFTSMQPIPPQQELEVKVAFPTSILNLPVPNWQSRKAGKVELSEVFGLLLFPTFLLLGWIIHLVMGGSGGSGGGYSSGGYYGGDGGGGGGGGG